jgi:hypothetical protein
MVHRYGPVPECSIPIAKTEWAPEWNLQVSLGALGEQCRLTNLKKYRLPICTYLIFLIRMFRDLTHSVKFRDLDDTLRQV